MNILLVNDDGYNKEGILILKEYLVLFIVLVTCLIDIWKVASCLSISLITCEDEEVYLSQLYFSWSCTVTIIFYCIL